MIDFTKCKATLVPKNEDLSSGLELYVRAKDVLNQLENLEKEKENLKTVLIWKIKKIKMDNRKDKIIDVIIVLCLSALLTSIIISLIKMIYA